MIEELQRTVIALTAENKELNGRNQSLRVGLADIGQKVGSFFDRLIELNSFLRRIFCGVSF